MNWTQAEDEKVRSLYLSHTRSQIGEVLGRTEGMVRSRCWTLGLSSKAPSEWTDEQMSCLVDGYSKTPVDLISLSKRIGKGNISRKARSLGLTNPRRRKVEERKDAPKYATKELRSEAMSAMRKDWLANNPHPRGALGMKHSKESLKKMSDAAKRAWKDADSGHNSESRRQAMSDEISKRIAEGSMRSGYSRSRGGKRDDLDGVYFRSAWEANYARYLNFLVRNGDIKGWEFEPKTFTFDAIKRGTRAYTPDFKVYANDDTYVWHEVKGWMDAKSKTRLARFAKYYPDEKLIVVDGKWFKSANKTMPGLIEGWETGTVHV